MSSKQRATGRLKGRFAFIIPVYNHAATVAQVAKQARAMNYPVFVVDDGSTDETPKRLAEIKDIHVLRHEKNEGKGAAIMTGFMAASHVADFAITIDADGQHDPEDALNLIEAIPLKKRPLVVGARKGMDSIRGAHIPWTSRFGRKFSNFWVRLSGGPKLSDTQSGMRIYPLPEAMSLPVRGRGVFSSKWKFWCRPNEKAFRFSKRRSAYPIIPTVQEFPIFVRLLISAEIPKHLRV
jgi:glycosyltransferase involved in cell wall biosynthesis